MKSLAPNAQIDGIDIDTKAIEWCKQNLNWASFALGKETPPIDYGADTFDFIYVVSVFTHLDEDYQFRWLEELRRIAKPGAVLLLTVNGLNDDKGFVFERSYEEGLSRRGIRIRTIQRTMYSNILVSILRSWVISREVWGRIRTWSCCKRRRFL